MSFDYFSKNRVEYILSKLKTIFDKKQDVPWVGTKALYEVQKNNIPDGTQVIITDDYDAASSSSTALNEVVAARVGANGTNYNDLKTRLDTEITTLNSDIVDLNSSITTINSNLATQSNINNQQSRDIKNLYEMAKGNLYTEQTDDTVARVKTIPSGACTYGTIDVLCGMSRKGKNLCDADDIVDGSYWNSNVWDSASFKRTNYTFPSGTYTISVKSDCPYTGNVYGMVKYVESSCSQSVSKGNSTTMTFTSEWGLTSQSSTDNKDMFNYVQVEIGSSSTSYEPYTENLIDAKVDTIITKKADNTVIKTKTIPQSIKSLDGYGIGINSTCYNYIDFDRKVFVKKVGSVDLGSLSYTKYAQQGMDSTYYTQLDSIVSYRGTEVANIICAKYETTSYYAWNRYGQIVSNTKWLQISDNNYSDATTFKNAMNGQILYYELATPTETDISSMLDTDADILTVEENGTLSFHYPSLDDGYSIDMPSTETYLIKL